jgi:hypothetical protein
MTKGTFRGKEYGQLEIWMCSWYLSGILNFINICMVKNHTSPICSNCISGMLLHNSSTSQNRLVDYEWCHVYATTTVSQSILPDFEITESSTTEKLIIFIFTLSFHAWKLESLYLTAIVQIYDIPYRKWVKGLVLITFKSWDLQGNFRSFRESPHRELWNTSVFSFFHPSVTWGGAASSAMCSHHSVLSCQKPKSSRLTSLGLIPPKLWAKIKLSSF